MKKLETIQLAIKILPFAITVNALDNAIVGSQENVWITFFDCQPRFGEKNRFVEACNHACQDYAYFIRGKQITICSEATSAKDKGCFWLEVIDRVKERHPFALCAILS